MRNGDSGHTRRAAANDVAEPRDSRERMEFPAKRVFPDLRWDWALISIQDITFTTHEPSRQSAIDLQLC